MTTSNETNIFEIALQKNLKFNYHGVLNVQDLFELSLTQLDELYRGLESGREQMNKASLFDTAKKNEMLDLSIEVVKAVFMWKKEQEDAAKLRKENLTKKRQLQELLARKQNEKLEGLDEDSLLKMIQDLS